MELKKFLILTPLIKDFCAYAPRKVLVVLLLMVVNGMTSGFGILLILPLLNSIGIGLGDGSFASIGVAQYIFDAANWIGLPLTLGYVLGYYLAIILVSATLNYLSSVLSVDLQRGFVVDLRNRIFQKVLHAKWRFLSSERMADFIRLSTVQVQQVGMSLNRMLSLVGQLIMVMIYAGLSLALSPTMTGLAVLCALGLVAILLPLNKRIHQSGKIELGASRQIFNDVIEQLGNLKIIKSFSAESQYLERMRETNSVLESQQLVISRYTALSRALNLCGGAIIFTLLFYLAVKFVELPVASLLVILFIFSRLMPKISSIQSMVQQLVHSIPNYADLLQKVESLDGHSELNESKSLCPEFNHELRLSQISFQYTGKKRAVFNDFSLSIEKNQTVAIVGPSGVGKSTLTDLIAGLIEPVSGQILIDGELLNESNQQLWRKKVAYVTQDDFLFNSSVKDNLAWCRSGAASDEEIWHALRLAFAEDFVRNLPEGLNTFIGDRGIKLSGGERQRLALARALLSNPEVLILDEATSALDRDSELKIQDALISLDGKITIIIIAHNETTIEHVKNRIYLEPIN